VDVNRSLLNEMKWKYNGNCFKLNEINLFRSFFCKPEKKKRTVFVRVGGE